MSENAVPIDEWRGCYDDSWKGLITNESFAHPAKFARGLIARIYQHIAEEGWADAGDIVIDPFGGIGLGGLGAMICGMHWIGSELEPRFVSLGDHCDCTGISPADWVRFYGRWSRVAYSGGRRWCPQCLAEAESVLDSVQLSLFGQSQSASYVRNSGKVPGTDPHQYAGNIELWRHKGYPGTARLLQGDGRDLIKVIGQAGLIPQPAIGFASPPYTDAKAHPSLGHPEQSPTGGDILHRCTTGVKPGDERYGEDPCNLGNLPPGDLTATISSPPYNLPMSQEHPGRGGGERGQWVPDYPRRGE